MKIGKLDIKKWEFNGRKLNNPFIIIWRMIWAIPLYLAVSLAAAVMAIFTLDWREFENVRSEIMQ